MKKLYWVCIFNILLLLATGSGSAVEVIRLTSCNWKPYNGENLLNYGFTSEIITKAFERTGYQTTFSFLPWKRAMRDTELGKFDGLYAAYYSAERAITFLPSDPYITGPLVLCARRDLDIHYRSLTDLRPYLIGVVKGYVNTPEFDAADYLKKDDFAIDDLMNLKKLIAGRIDLIVIDKYLAIFHLKNSPMLSAGLDDVRFLDPPLAEKTLHIMFSRKVANFEKKAADFNRGLSMIKQDGTYTEILIKHGFLPAD